MAVQPASLEVLEKAAVPPAQARAIVQAIEIEIAGARDLDEGTAYWIRLLASPDGSFRVLNQRSGEWKTYAAHSR